MTRVRFKNFPLEIRHLFFDKWNSFPLCKLTDKIGSTILKEILQMDIKYHHCDSLFEEDIVVFKNENEYTLFLLKYDLRSSI